MFIFKSVNFFPKLLAASLAILCIFPAFLYVHDHTWSRRVGTIQTSIGSKINLFRRPRIEISQIRIKRHHVSKRLWYSHGFNRGISARGISYSYEANAPTMHTKRRIVPPVTPSRPLSAGIYQDGDDYSYFAEVHLGSEASKMYMLLDTGAPVTWVMGNDCKSPICTSRNTFGAQNSSTYKFSNERFSVTYGTGECSGTMAEDTVSFAGLSFRMPFGIADKVSANFENFEIYGILGLSAAKSETPSFLDTVIASKSLQTNMFGISLSQDKDGTNTGVINFGSPDPTRFTGALKYYPVVTDSGDWKIKLSSAGFDEIDVPLDRTALMDTGTSFILAPPQDVAKIYALIPGAVTIDKGSTWLVPCDATANLVFKFGMDKYTIPSTAWVGPPATGSQCQSNIGVFNSEEWVLGDYFMKYFYVAFDVDNRKIGLAAAKFPTPSSITSSTTAATPPITSATSGSLDPNPRPQTSATSAIHTNATNSIKAGAGHYHVYILFFAFMIGTMINNDTYDNRL